MLYVFSGAALRPVCERDLELELELGLVPPASPLANTWPPALKSEISALARSFDNTREQDIEKTIHDWAAPSAAPEFSDTATEYSDYNPEFTIHRNGIFSPRQQAQAHDQAIQEENAGVDVAAMPPPGLAHPLDDASRATVRPARR